MVATGLAGRTAVALRSQLFLVINKTAYRVRPIPSMGSDGIKAFRLGKADGTLYDVAQTPFGASCDCPDFVFRRDGLDPTGCKHVKALVAQGLIEDALVVDEGGQPEEGGKRKRKMK